MKKALSIILCLCIVLSVFAIVPFSATAAEDEITETGATSGTTGDCTWTLNGTELTISGNGKMENYPYSYYSTHPWGNSITKVTITNGVTNVGSYAFYKCSSLTSITIPDSVTSIGYSAFYGCSSLTSVTIPDSVTSIGVYAFGDCTGLTNITIPDSVTSIGDYAFFCCDSLTSVTIPDSVTSIGKYAFFYCTGLTSVSIGNSVTSISDNAFYYCTGLTSVTIPDSVTSIGDSAFGECTGLTSVTIPDSVTSIGVYAFGECLGLTSVSIGNSVTSISNYAFDRCTSLTSVTIPDSVTSIGESAFYGCSSLTSFTIPDSVTSIDAEAFLGCSGLTSITIPDSVTMIGYCALGYFFNDEEYSAEKFSDFVICGFKGTEAEQYANDNDICFKEIRCSRCGRTLTLDNLAIDNEIPASCTETGLSKGSHCPDCGEAFKAQKITPVTEHTPVTDKAIPATCTKTGLTEGSHCSVCGDVLQAQEVIPKTEHTPVTDKAIPATCTETGLTEGSHCSVCGEVLQAQEVIPATGHKPIIDKAVEATCQHAGHTIGSYCEYCGEVYVQSEVIPQLPHTPVTDPAVAASCTHTGLTKGSHCSVCGDVITEQMIIAKLAHKPSGKRRENNLPATCETDGSYDEAVYCTACGEELSRNTVVTKALGHAYAIVPAKAATFFRPGLSEGVQCTRCGYQLIAPDTIPVKAGSGIFCDVDEDGEVTSLDVAFIQRKIALIEIPFVMNEDMGDADGDLVLTIMDASAIQRYLAELPSFYGIGKLLPDDNSDRKLIESVEISEDAVTLFTGQKRTLNVTVAPEDADNRHVIWSSSDTSVAKVDQSGDVTAVKKGTAKIYATAADASGVKVSCTITVKDVKVSSITLSFSSISLKKGQSTTLTATVSPTNADNKTLLWSSSDTAVATVDQSGKVTAVKPGTATIYAAATDGSGVKAACAITVKPIKVSSITLSASSISLKKGQSTTLTATVSPANADNKTLQWSSSDTDVAAVDQSGKVTAVKPGTATIYATATDDSGVQASCAITVESVKVSSITLSSSSFSLTEGYSDILTATVSPSNADNKELQWSSSNTSVARVDQSGKVIAVKPGTATIYAAATDGSGVKVSCTVTVNSTLMNFNNVIAYILANPDEINSDGSAQIIRHESSFDADIVIKAKDDYLEMTFTYFYKLQYVTQVSFKVDFNKTKNITIYYIGTPMNGSGNISQYIATVDARTIEFEPSIDFRERYTGKNLSSEEKKQTDSVMKLAFASLDYLLVERTYLWLSDIGFTSYVEPIESK